MNTEELTQRLFYQQEEKSKKAEEKRQTLLKENETRLLWTNQKLTREREKGMVERVYVQQIARMEATRDKNIKQLEESAKAKNRKNLSQSEVVEVVSRMYATEVERRKANSDGLTKRYQPAPVRKVLDGNKLKEVNSRLYDDAKGKKEDTRKKLMVKHQPDDLPPIKKLSKGQQKDMVWALVCLVQSLPLPSPTSQAERLTTKA